MFGLSGKEFLAGLRAAMLGRGSGPRARIQGMWDALENMFRSADFNDSFAVRAVIAVRPEPGQPVPSSFVEHYRAVRAMLTELVCTPNANGAPGAAAEAGPTAAPDTAATEEPDPDPDPDPDHPSRNGAAGASPNAWRLANQLEMLVQGAIAGSAIDQEPTAMVAARELSMIALTINGFQTS